MLKSESIAKNLVVLPTHPDSLPWPTDGWPKADLEVADQALFDKHAEAIFDLTEVQGATYGLVIVKGGQIVYERYSAGATRFYLQYSWSMAKSIVHAMVGILVRDGKIDIYEPAAVEEWQEADDPRRHLTVDQLLRMSSGLEFLEDYVGRHSDVIQMLNFAGRDDMGAFAARKPLAHEPDSFWYYSSGTTNIICRILKNIIGNGPTGMLNFMNEELFEPIGMRSATPRFDLSGTFIGSSFLLDTPRDFARFGYFYLRDGVWEGKRILPEGWVDYGRSCTYEDAEQAYGAHWWLTPGKSSFYASGHDGQRILIAPEKDLVVVRNGMTPVDEIQNIWDNVNALVEMF
jgi:CubicO group peptidase (beta-lactamase class C family)